MLVTLGLSKGRSSSSVCWIGDRPRCSTAPVSMQDWNSGVSSGHCCAMMASSAALLPAVAPATPLMTWEALAGSGLESTQPPHA